MRELTVCLIKVGFGVVVGYLSAVLGVVSHWGLTIPLAALTYIGITYALLGATISGNPGMTRKRAWTVGIGAYSTSWLMSWITFYNIVLTAR